MGQLMRILLQAIRLMEEERKDEIGKEVDEPLAGSPARSFVTGEEDGISLYIRSEDVGLFQLFLREAPALLTGIQSNLILLSTGQKADLHRLHHLFHVLQGQWGFLGFLQMVRLCQAAESLLDVFLTQTLEPRSEDVNALLKALA